MQAVMSFNEVLEAVDHLSLTEQESLIEIPRRWLAEKRQAELVKDVQEARKEFRLGVAEESTVDDIMAEMMEKRPSYLRQ